MSGGSHRRPRMVRRSTPIAAGLAGTARTAAAATGADPDPSSASALNSTAMYQQRHEIGGSAAGPRDGDKSVPHRPIGRIMRLTVTIPTSRPLPTELPTRQIGCESISMPTRDNKWLRRCSRSYWTADRVKMLGL